MRTIGRFAPLLALLLAPRPASATTDEGFTNRQAVKVGDNLTKQLQVPSEKRIVIHDRLQDWMADTRTKKYGDLPISGVFAYQAGEGGVIVKVIQGKGLLRYYGDERERRLRLKSVTAGAQIGGSSEYGVGVVLGPNAPKTFGGEYRMTQVAAAAGGAGVTTAEIKKKNAGPEADRAVLLGTATGLTGTAAGGKLKVIVGH